MKDNYRSRKPQRGGFTLIEVMIVLFIIVMIMGTAVVAVQGQRNKAQRQTALAYVKMLANAVDRYDVDTGRLPTTAEGLAALVTCPPGVSEGKWGGPYIKDSATSVDPWGNEYQYVSPGKHGTFDVWSYGPDGMDGTDDDIGNWKNDL